jgi:hypothetical protein
MGADAGAAAAVLKNRVKIYSLSGSNGFDPENTWRYYYGSTAQYSS